MNGLDLYDFHARQYDPVLGRFTTPDPIDRLTDYNGVMSIYITITKRKTNRYCKD
jgi:RHS repeat-associated protein